MKMDGKFILNLPAISEDEQKLLATKRVLVAGCGGLGGYICEYLARLGVSNITVLDYDHFEESNINRQLLATSSSMGKSKADTAKERILSINQNAEVLSINEQLSSENAVEIIRGHSLVIDALDSVKSRLILEDACSKFEITMIHGAVHGWNFQTAVIPPGSGVLNKLYDESTESINKTILSFVPPCCAAIQVSEALRFLCGRPSVLENKVLFFNMETLENILVTV